MALDFLGFPDLKGYEEAFSMELLLVALEFEVMCGV